MRAATPALPAFETTLTILSGPGRGTVYRVVARRVTIGRGSDNDIVIGDDPKSSRNHAELVMGPMGYEIRDISDKNVISVDGVDTRMALLRNQSVFVLGHTQFSIQYKNHAPTALGLVGETRSPQHRTGAQRAKKKTSPLKFAYGALGLFVIWMLVNNSNSKENKKILDQDINLEIRAAEQVKQQTEERSRPKNVSPNDIGYQQAQQAFVIGSRDYRKGQYERALSSFQACLSLYPAHALCNRYMSLTQRKFSELIQYHMDIGRKYRDQNQFAPCAISFRNVMVMIKDTNNKRYAEAKANFEACSSRVEERF